MINETYKKLYLNYKLYLLITVPFSVILGIVSMLVLSIINESISVQASQQSDRFTLYFIAIGILFLVGLAIELIRVRLVANVTYDMQTEMIKNIISTPFEKLEKIGLPRIIATLTNDLEVGIEMFHFIPHLIVNFFLVAVGFIYLFLLSGKLLLVIMLLLLLGILVISFLVHLTSRQRTSIRDSNDHIINGYEAIVKGSKELILNSHRMKTEKSQLFQVILDIRKNSIFIFNRVALAEQFGQYILFLILGLIVFVFSKNMGLSNEVVVGYILVLLFLIEPIETLFLGFDQIMDGKVAFNKVTSLGLGGTKPSTFSPDINTTASDDNEKDSCLVLKDITYEYKDNEAHGFSIGPIDTVFKPGEISFITGGNGSGKSTLIKLLSGLYSPTEGDISFSGALVSSHNLPTYQSNISLVAQDYWLFKNIINPDGGSCNQEQVNDYLNMLQLDSLVDIDHCEFSTLKLSQGQRKRLALIQALLEDRKIILLDEWAADQDYDFKKLFYNKILHELKMLDKIVIIISHDEHFFHVADRILKISKGHLMELEEV